MTSLKTLIGYVVTQVQAVYDLTASEKPYYYYGHGIDIINELVDKSKSATYMAKRFPMIALLFDQDEQIRNNGYQREAVNIEIAIATFTKATFTEAERYAYSFETASTGLYTIYDYFMYYLSKSPYFACGGIIPDHTKTDRPYWGRETAGRNDAMKLIEPIDAIVITDLNLKIIKTC